MDTKVTSTLRKVFLAVLLLFLIVSFAAYKFSPYDQKILSAVDIEMPCEITFDYLGDSENAKDWSVFVAFIETINSAVIPDGEVGSKRICYTKEDHTGFNWEEEVLEVKPNEYRKISCYNFENLGINTPNLATEQIYRTTDEGCKVMFTLDFIKKPGFIDLVKMKFAAYRIKSIFDKNLANIKGEVLKKRRP